MDGDGLKRLSSQDLEAEDTDLPIDWLDVLNDPRISPDKQEARELCSRLTLAPLLELITESKKALDHYKGVPQPAPPRKNNIDKIYYSTQTQLADAMNLCVQCLENPQNLTCMQVAAAFVRSAYEDLHQSRRRLCAGRQSFKLERRPDAGENTLSTKDENKALRQRPWG